MIIKRPPNLVPIPRSEKEIRLLLQQQQQYAAAYAHRLQWAIDHPFVERPSTLKSVQVPASAERAQYLNAMLEKRS